MVSFYYGTSFRPEISDFRLNPDVPSIAEGSGFIIDLADIMGSMLEHIMLFVANLFNGYVLILMMLFIGVIISIYFRFFRNIVVETNKR